MIILGIDPGIDGAICLINNDGLVVAIDDMPTLQIGKTAKRSLNYHVLSRIVWQAKAGHAFVEHTWNRPGEGHSGALVGCYMAILATMTTAGVPWTAVSPQLWKKALGVPAAKDGARARASQLNPQAADWWLLKKHDGRSEAYLIARYGLSTFHAMPESLQASSAPPA